MEWEDGLKSEVDFWENWYRTKGLDWPADYAFRIDPDTEIQEWIRPYLVESRKTEVGRPETEMPLILDVGSGPLTVLGKKWNDQPLRIIACDALAMYYGDMNSRYGIIPLVITEPCKAEFLSVRYKPCSFDLVYAQNCIDHSEDPVKAICEMIRVCKPGGKVLLMHEEHEGQNEGYQGLHQWDFYAQDGRFMISGKGEVYNINLILDGILIETELTSGYIKTIIHKP